jgi:hypothetical protein
MLLDALAVATQKTVNDLYDSIHLLHNSLNHWTDFSVENNSSGNNESKSSSSSSATSTSASSSASFLSPFYSLCHSFGIVDEKDSPFRLILLNYFEYYFKQQAVASPNKSGLVEKDLHYLQYLPVMASGLWILTDLYDGSGGKASSSSSSSTSSHPIDFTSISSAFPSHLSYHAFNNIYSTNAHIIPFSLNKLFLFTFHLFQLKKWTMDPLVIGTSLYDERKVITSPFGGKNAMNIPMQITYQQTCYLNYIEKNYLAISSQVLLILSNNAIASLTNPNMSTAPPAQQQQQLNYQNIPFHALFGLLLYFMEFSPSFVYQNKHSLEKYFPYDLFHSATMDISLGKYNFHETLHKFANN